MKANLKIFDQFEQNTPPWDHVRLGLITASDYALLLRTGRGGGESVTRKRRVFQCAWELRNGARSGMWQGNKFTERGHEQEQEAFELYCDTRVEDRETVSKPAFIRDDSLRTGCSPDALIGSKGILEIKTMEGHLFYELMEDPRVPPQYAAQCQGLLMITGCQWLDLMIYSPPEAPLVLRVIPDPNKIRELTKALGEFNAEVEGVVLRRAQETAKTCQDRLDARLEEVIAEWQEQQCPDAPEMKHEAQMADLTPEDEVEGVG